MSPRMTTGVGYKGKSQVLTFSGNDVEDQNIDREHQTNNNNRKMS